MLYEVITPGEHIGLSVMTERARQLSGELHIESERVTTFGSVITSYSIHYTKLYDC